MYHDLGACTYGSLATLKSQTRRWIQKSLYMDFDLEVYYVVICRYNRKCAEFRGSGLGLILNLLHEPEYLIPRELKNGITIYWGHAGAQYQQYILKP